MAEIATGVLHNVGNTLNSVNISAHLIADRLRKLRVPGVIRAATLLREHASELGPFLTTDPRGQQFPVYLQALSEELHEEQEAIVKETGSLVEGIEHIKAIISMQQRHARTVGAVEPLSVPQLIDEALRLHAVSFERLNIRIERDFAEVPSLVTDRHKLMQILMNLLINARQALESSERQDKWLRIQVGLTADRGHLFIQVSDNGVGIVDPRATAGGAGASVRGAGSAPGEALQEALNGGGLPRFVAREAQAQAPLLTLLALPDHPRLEPRPSHAEQAGHLQPHRLALFDLSELGAHDERARLRQIPQLPGDLPVRQLELAVFADDEALARGRAHEQGTLRAERDHLRGPALVVSLEAREEATYALAAELP
jgi:hypothetical protein